MVGYAIEQQGLSEQQACRLFQLSRTVYRYKTQSRNDQAIEATLLELADQHPRWGFRKMMQWLKNREYGWNYKRVHRVYRQLELNLRVKCQATAL